MYARTRLPATSDAKQSSLPARTSLAEPSSLLLPKYENAPPSEQEKEYVPELPKLNPAGAGHSFDRIAVSTPRRPVAQFKLTVGQPNDQYEQEADRVADQVMRMPEPTLPAFRVASAYRSYSTQEQLRQMSVPVPPALRVASLQRSYSTEEQLRQMPMPVTPALRVASLFRTPAIQRMCPECEKEVQRQPMEEEEKKKEEETLQTKPLAESITPLVQRQTQPTEEEKKKEEETLQTKPLAESITPLVQRQTQPTEEEKKKEEETLQTKTTFDEAPTVSTNLQEQISALQGGGQPLSQSERHFFEPRFGTDFSQVRVHADNRAAEASRAVNARAFTLGRDVVFGAGQYQPRSSEGQRLLAHELTHVVQQTQEYVQPNMQNQEVSFNNGMLLEHEAGVMRTKTLQMRENSALALQRLAENECGKKIVPSSPITQSKSATEDVIQRTIIIGGKPVDQKKKADMDWEHIFDKAALEIINRMDNGGKPPDFVFNSEDQFKTEINVRKNAIRGMEEIHKGCCNYPDTTHPTYLNDQYWDRKAPYHFVPKSPLPPGKQASDAIEAIFAPGANTRLDCWTIMVAVEYYAMLKGVGANRFNQMFPQGTGLEISWRGTSNYPQQCGANFIFNKYKTVNVSSAAELLPGDWVYFKNFLDYTTRHPGGLWQGENAIYMGDGKYQGFGSGLKTEKEMNDHMVNVYNQGFPILDWRTVENLLNEGGGLLLHGVHRPAISTM